MTDNQFNALLATIAAGLAGIGLAIRFAASRIIAALDANSQAMLKNTESNAVLATKIDGVGEYIYRRDRDSPTPVHGVPTVTPNPTPPGQYSLQYPRKKTEPGENR